LNKPVLVPKAEVTSLGSSIFAFLAAGTFRSIKDAQDAICPDYHVVEPDAAAARVYEELYQIYRELYFGFGAVNSEPMLAGGILPTLRRIAAAARGAV